MSWLLNTKETLLGTNAHWCLTFSAGLFVPARKVAVLPGRRLALPGKRTSDSGMSHWCRRTCWQEDTVLSSGQSPLCSSVMGNCRKPACAQVPQRDSLMAQTCWGEGRPKDMQHGNKSLRAGYKGALPALVSAQRGQQLCKTTGLILEIIFLILLCLPQQTVPQPSHPPQQVGDSSCPASLSGLVAGPWRWGMLFPAATVTAVRVPIHHPCLCYKRHPSTVPPWSGSNGPGLIILWPRQICLQWLVFNNNPRS